VALWIAPKALSGTLAVVPEYIAFCNALLLIAALVVLVVLARHAWLWLRWWSIPIDVVLLGLALLPVGLVAEDLLWQLQPAPSEGFLYRGGFGLCGTYVVGATQNLESGDRSYVLQEYCIPDGPERRTTYIRSGASPFMRKINLHP
jgi:hypothetical protein